MTNEQLTDEQSAEILRILKEINVKMQQIIDRLDESSKRIEAETAKMRSKKGIKVT